MIDGEAIRYGAAPKGGMTRLDVAVKSTREQTEQRLILSIAKKGDAALFCLPLLCSASIIHFVPRNGTRCSGRRRSFPEGNNLRCPLFFAPCWSCLPGCS